MSQFLRDALGAGQGDDDAANAEYLRVYDEAHNAGAAAAKVLLERSKEWADKRDFYHASVFMFIAVWTIVRAIFSGVESSNEKRGVRNDVNRMWHAIRTAFSTTNDKLAHERIRKFEQRWEEGFYDEWH